MYSMRLFHWVVLALAVICVSRTWALDDNVDLVLRQDDGGDSSNVLPTEIPGVGDGDDGADGSNETESPSAEPTSTAESTPSSTSAEEPTSTEAEPTSTSEEPTSEVPPETSTSETAETTTSSTSEQSPTTTPPPESTTTSDDETTTTTSTSTEDQQDDEPTTTKKPIVSTTFEVVTKTNDDGSKQTMTTAQVTTTLPETQDGGDGGSSGLPEGTRNIVIGVVVGIGGAILLGALAVVAWRIRSRRKAGEEAETLMEYTGGYTPVDKGELPSTAPGTHSSSTGRTPFQPALQEYHHQPSSVNTSSNF